jgi:hypothetical protein
MSDQLATITKSKHYLLWHWKSGNVAGEFETAEEAIDVLAQSFDETELDHVGEYFLELYKDGHGFLYSDSDDLVKLVAEHMHALSR